MNAPVMRSYWSSKYFDRFNKKYKSEKRILELTLLKNLIKRHDEYIVIEAIDTFLTTSPESISSICFFATKKVFDNKFSDIIKSGKILKYKRHLRFYENDIKDRAAELVEEYIDYFDGLMMHNSDIERQIDIIKELEEIEALHAERIGRTADLSD
jgi:ribosomal protein S17E